jgi:hypothetical protein
LADAQVDPGCDGGCPSPRERVQAEAGGDVADGADAVDLVMKPLYALTHQRQAFRSKWSTVKLRTVCDYLLNGDVEATAALMQQWSASITGYSTRMISSLAPKEPNCPGSSGFSEESVRDEIEGMDCEIFKSFREEHLSDGQTAR